MADTKLSDLTELAATPANDDEVYIRDVSEAAEAESKRITVANLEGATTGVHGASTDHLALFGAASTLVNRVVWKDASEVALADTNRTTDLDWTDLDLTATTSATAKFVIIQFIINTDAWTDGYCRFAIRKNGTTPVSSIRLYHSVELGTTGRKSLLAICGLDSGQVIEYEIHIVGTGQYDSSLEVLGYIE